MDRFSSLLKLATEQCMHAMAAQPYDTTPVAALLEALQVHVRDYKSHAKLDPHLHSVLTVSHPHCASVGHKLEKLVSLLTTAAAGETIVKEDDRAFLRVALNGWQGFISAT